MPSHLRATLVMVTLLGAVSCSRTSSSDPGKWSFPKPTLSSGSKTDDTAWQVKCDALCDVKAKSASLDGLCAAASESAKLTLGPTRCEVRRAIGFPAIPASAVTDAAILELSSNSGAPGTTEKNGFLAIKTATGWQVARSLGKAPAIRTVSAIPVDLPAIQPAGVQLHVALIDGTSKSERVFVCGLTGDGSTVCPVAVEVAGKGSNGVMQMQANAADALTEWRAAIEITPKGYVAKRVSGTLPAGLAGEHSYVAAAK